MTSPRSDFLRELTARGFVKDCTDLEGLDAKAAKGEVVGYIGYDATADSLHVGHLTQIMLLHWLQQTGNKPIALMGGGTTKIGDPSGRDETRQLLTNDQINANIASIRGVFENYLQFGGGAKDAMMVNNADWLDGLQYIPFLRDIGRHFTINRMLTFDSVKLRLDREQPLTFLEFNYMILQAYDFMELNRRHGCTLQMGGSDQYGNIVNGIDLARRVNGAELYGLTSPLLTTASGQKMGKTAGGAVWLNAARLSNFDFWQYWRNTEDADVGRFLKLFTTLPLAEIAKLDALQGSEINEAKKILANEITRLCRGDAAAQEAAETARQTFELGQAGGSLPVATVSAAALEAGVPVVDLLVQAGLTTSKGEARRLIQQGGIRLNDQPVTDATALVRGDALGADGSAKLSAGKKKHALVKVG